MRYFTYLQQNELGDDVFTTVSEDDIREYYYPQWKMKMYCKYGKKVVDKNYSFLECLQDWQIINFAWEVTSGE